MLAQRGQHFYCGRKRFWTGAINQFPLIWARFNRPQGRRECLSEILEWLRPRLTSVREEAAGVSHCFEQLSNLWTAGWLWEGSGLLVVAEEGPLAHFLIYLDGQIHFLVDIVVSCDICTPYIIIVFRLGLIGLKKSFFRMK